MRTRISVAGRVPSLNVKCTQHGADFVAVAHVGARCIEAPAAIAEPLQFEFDLVGVERESGIQLERLRVHARGHRPTATVERRA